MKHFLPLCCLLSLLLPVACTEPADPLVVEYERSLCSADSLLRTGSVDSTQVASLLADLHRRHEHAARASELQRRKIFTPVMANRIAVMLFAMAVSSLAVQLYYYILQRRRKKKLHDYAQELGKSEESLRDNEHRINELKDCLYDLNLSGKAQDEVLESLMILGERTTLLRDEVATLRTRLKEYEEHSLHREQEQLAKQHEQVRHLDEQLCSLRAALIDRNELVVSLRQAPRYLNADDWHRLAGLVDRVYEGLILRLRTRFPQLTDADLQLCLLMRLGFPNARIATLIAVSPASVSQQKFRLKKRLMQTEEALFANGRTLDEVVGDF